MSKFHHRIILFINIISLGFALSTHAQQSTENLPLHQIPTKTGQVFTIDDWDNKVTQNDLGSNYFAGNTGATESVGGLTTLDVVEESNGSIGGSLAIGFDFTGQGSEVFAGYFASVFGLTDTFISLDGSGLQPSATTPLPNYFLDTQDFYHGFLPLPNRSVEFLRFDVRLESNQPVSLKVQLQDENGFDVFARRTLNPTGGVWQTLSFSLPSDFIDSIQGMGNPASFDWRRVSVFGLVIERNNFGAGITNPDTGRFLVDNLELVDSDGAYPDLTQIQDPAAGTLDPRYETAFLDWIRATSTLYFLDWASTDSRSGSIIQDRSISADLLTVGGVGFQLTAYVIAAERGYITRADAADRVVNILRVLHDHPQGPGRVGTIGHQGFFYHFLGIDGRRKQNFDVTATPSINESLNTVELSTIDTALAIAGVVTTGQYFQQDTVLEAEIRTLAEAVYGRVNWPFMLNTAPGLKQNQFYLGWKPLEAREGAAFEFLDANGEGHYSGTSGNPQTIDFYTDEGLLIALLAMGSPNPTHRLDRQVWDAMIRDDEGGPLVKTFPGSLFTYQFFSAWLDTERLGTDNHPSRSVNFYTNTREAILTAIAYTENNPRGRMTFTHPQLWGLSATEGPFDTYFAEAAPGAAIHPNGEEPMGVVSDAGELIILEGEDGQGDDQIMPRSEASSEQTVQLDSGESRGLPFDLTAPTSISVTVCYSNDNFGPLEQIDVTIDGMMVGSFSAQDTGGGGFGWNVFLTTGVLGTITLAPGSHEVRIAVSGGDGFGVEIDKVNLQPLPILRPLEVGTVTHYGVGSAMAHTPQQAIAALWNNAQREDLNQDGEPELLHPRFGFADALNLDIADAVIPGAVDCNDTSILRCNGPWINFTGFSIDHGPMLILIDNYLHGHAIPDLFMSHPTIQAALHTLFPELAINRFSPVTGRGHLPRVNASGLGAFDVSMTLQNVAAQEFVLQRIQPTFLQTETPASFSPDTGILHIPVLFVPDEMGNQVRFEVFMTLIPGTQTFQAVVTGVNVLP